jgi:hypothetical protein
VVARARFGPYSDPEKGTDVTVRPFGVDSANSPWERSNPVPVAWGRTR